MLLDFEVYPDFSLLYLDCESRKSKKKKNKKPKHNTATEQIWVDFSMKK